MTIDRDDRVELLAGLDASISTASGAELTRLTAQRDIVLGLAVGERLETYDEAAMRLGIPTPVTVAAVATHGIVRLAVRADDEALWLT